jgi:ferric-dicitrate binding protein FerR (iron transport regulator)
MRSTTCEEIEELIERETLGWSEGQRLRVEQHLSECEACRETLALSRFVRDTLREAAGELPEMARSRAINAALTREGGRRFSTTPSRSRWLGAGVGVLGVAAAVALVVVLARSGSDLAKAPEQPPAKSAPATEAPRLASSSKTSGNAEATGAAGSKPAAELAAASATADEPTWIDAVARQQHQFAHADVALVAGTRARFHAASHTLELSEGRVEVDVDHARGEPFAVLTRNFRVEVLGTQFAVTPSSVSVQRGKVQVFARDGSVLARELAAGGSYHYGRDAAVSESAASTESTAQQAKPKPEAPRKSAGVWLSEARASLASGDSKATRGLIDHAESSQPSRPERAEAKTLRAEAALLERDSKSALRLYRDVSEHFADLAAGDNAAFAAAQLSARADPVHERELLESYLTHFPRGRFRDEAKQRLARLPAR